MIEYYQKIKGNKIKKESKFSKGSWIDVTAPSEEELTFLEKEFKLDIDNLKDGLDVYETPRFEQYQGKSYIYLTVPTEKVRHENVSSFLIVYSKDFFMTLSSEQLEIFKIILDTKKKFANFSNSRNLLRILFSISRLFEQKVRKLMKETNAGKSDLKNLTNKDVVKLIRDEDKLNDYISSFGAIINTYNRILREKSIKFVSEDEEVVEDLIIDLNETLSLCKLTLKTISNMRDYYSTKISNDLNNTVKVLTIFTIFLSIPTLVASIYGMNIDLPLQNHSHIFSLLIFLIAGIISIFLVLLKKWKVI